MSFLANSTLATPDTYFGIYNELSKYNVHLNIFERLWAVSDANGTPLRLMLTIDPELVCLHAKRCPRHRYHELRHARDCLLWSEHSLDHNRPHTIFQQIQASGAKDPHRRRAMGMHETRSPQSLHRRITSDLALPPNGEILRHGYRRSLPFMADNLLPDRSLFRVGGCMALLDAPRLPLRLLLQERPQDPSPIFRAFRTRCRICLPY